MKRVNVYSVETETDPADPDGYRAGMARFGPRIGARMLGASVYDVPPAQSICPYHYEYGNEEWLMVLDGRATLRHAAVDGDDDGEAGVAEGEAETVLEPGDTVCFPEGKAGAHKVTNRTDQPLRVLMLSTMAEPSVAVYPDSDKIGVWPGDERDHVLVRRESHVEYYDREV
jgi:uncharacterized cupin superfamily protein